MSSSKESYEKWKRIAEMVDDDEMTYQEIGAKLGMTKQAVYQQYLKYKKLTKEELTRYSKGLKNVKYQRIKDYVKEQHMSLYCWLTSIGFTKGETRSITHFLIEGQQVKMDYLIRLLEATGLTFEELFTEKDMKARWQRVSENGCYWYKCSNCHVETPYDRYGHWAFTSHCPECGKEMTFDEV